MSVHSPNETDCVLPLVPKKTGNNGRNTDNRKGSTDDIKEGSRGRNTDIKDEKKEGGDNMKAMVGFFRAFIVTAMALALIGTAVVLVELYKVRDITPPEATAESTTVLSESDVLAKGSGNADAIATGITPIGGSATAGADAERIDLTGSVVSDATVPQSAENTESLLSDETATPIEAQETADASATDNAVSTADTTSAPIADNADSEQKQASPVVCTDICFVSAALLMLFHRAKSSRNKAMKSAAVSITILSKGAVLKLRKKLFVEKTKELKKELLLTFSEFCLSPQKTAVITTH